MSELTVIQSKKKSYKPTLDNYYSAMIRLEERKKETGEPYTEQSLYLMVKIIRLAERDISEMQIDKLKALFMICEKIPNLVSEMTPRQFMNLFPVAKEYDGAKLDMKDYFWCMENMPCMDQPIEDSENFLMEYWNGDILLFNVSRGLIVSRLSREFLGFDPMCEFFNDVPHYYEDHGYMVNADTGERVKIQKSKRRKPKQFTVLK